MELQNKSASGVKYTGGISGFILKMIAVLTMLIDHMAAVVLAEELFYSPAKLLESGYYRQWLALYELMRIIGRMAFPIYCFLLVEGFLHTRSALKYAQRLFLFALVSEVPFDLAFNRTWWDMSYNNVFFTLLLGLFVMIGIRWAEERFRPRSAEGWKHWRDLFIRSAAVMTVVLAGMFIAEDILCTDYGAGGVAAIAALYLLREHRIAAFTAAVLLLVLLCSGDEIAALLMLVPVYLYNGTRGRQMKYAFYVFYPVHLLILAGIAHFLG